MLGKHSFVEFNGCISLENNCLELTASTQPIEQYIITAACSVAHSVAAKVEESGKRFYSPVIIL